MNEETKEILEFIYNDSDLFTLALEIGEYEEFVLRAKENYDITGNGYVSFRSKAIDQEEVERIFDNGFQDF